MIRMPRLGSWMFGSKSSGRRSARRAATKRRATPVRGLEQLETRTLLTGTWTNLTNLAPSSTGTMMLLSDGTVMVQAGGTSKTWSNLTPDSSGSYSKGTWSQLASMNLERLFFGSNVLKDGRVFLVGGEYSVPGSPAELYQYR